MISSISSSLRILDFWERFGDFDGIQNYTGDFIATCKKTEIASGITSTYYIRIQHFSSSKNLIKQLETLGHRIGYHYENLSSVNGDIHKAYTDFCSNLEALRRNVLVKTACAHGSPLSRWDNKTLWNHFDIHTLGIDYEPMLDTDFSKTLYLTDTGRRWDGYKVSLRDKVPQYQGQWKEEGLIFHSTDDIIKALNNPTHPIHQKELLINTHPQRWMPFGLQWVKETVTQNIKNIIKRIIVSTRWWKKYSP